MQRHLWNQLLIPIFICQFSPLIDFCLKCKIHHLDSQGSWILTYVKNQSWKKAEFKKSKFIKLARMPYLEAVWIKRILAIPSGVHIFKFESIQKIVVLQNFSVLSNSHQGATSNTWDKRKLGKEITNFLIKCHKNLIAKIPSIFAWFIVIHAIFTILKASILGKLFDLVFKMFYWFQRIDYFDKCILIKYFNL